MNTENEKTGAIFSDCRKYRFLIWRIWDKTKLPVAFLMLNPSTADEVKNDPTVERCERRARSMGAGGLFVLNIFALRSTDPKALYSADDPVGEGNDASILNWCFSVSMVICAWGKHGNFKNRGAFVISLLKKSGIKPFCLALNKDGTPKHPLYVSYSVEPKPFEI